MSSAFTRIDRSIEVLRAMLVAFNSQHRSNDALKRRAINHSLLQNAFGAPR
jgi:hypothetical protein